VVTAPDRPRGRGRKPAPPDAKKLAAENHVEILQPENLKNPEFLQRLDDIAADFFCVVAFRILPEEVFSRPPKGCVNLHGSLLPAYRGAAPINWAIINGETETGLTTFFIGRKVDTGAIIMRERLPIGPNETFGELHDRMAELGGDILIKTMDKVEAGDFKLVEQDHSLATPAPKLDPELGRIDWNKRAVEIHNLVRGLSPKPGAYTFLDGKRLNIIKSELVKNNSGLEPGTVTLADPKEGITIACGDGQLKILNLKPESGKMIAGAEYVRGYRLSVGQRFSRE